MSTTFLSIDKFQINLNRLENGCFLDDLEKILTFKMTLLYRVFASFEFISRSQNEVKWSASSLMGIYLNPYSSLKCVQLDKSCHSHALICFPRFDWLVVSDMLVIVVTMIDPFAHQMSKHGCMGRIEQEKSFQIRLEYIPDPNPGSRAHREDREGPAHGWK